MVERRIKAARFPAIIGKTHLAIGIGLAACQQGIKTRFATAIAQFGFIDNRQMSLITVSDRPCLVMTFRYLL